MVRGQQPLLYDDFSNCPNGVPDASKWSLSTSQWVRSAAGTARRCAVVDAAPLSELRCAARRVSHRRAVGTVTVALYQRT